MWCGGEASAPCFPGNDSPVIVTPVAHFGVVVFGGGCVFGSEEDVSGDVEVGDFPVCSAVEGPELYR